MSLLQEAAVHTIEELQSALASERTAREKAEADRAREYENVCTVTRHLSSAQEEVKRLRSALEPFAFAAYPTMFNGTDGEVTGALICHSDVQRAREALKEPTDAAE